MSWLRLYTDLKSNPKVHRLSAKEFRTWVFCMCIAKESGNVLPPIEDIAFHVRAHRATVEMQIQKLIEVRLIDRIDNTLRMHNWDERQFISDDINARVKRWRDAKRNVACNVTCNTDVTDQTQTQTQTQSTESEKPTPKPPRQKAARGGGVSESGWKETAFADFWDRCVWAKIGRGASWAEYRLKATTPELAEQINAAAKEQGPRLLAEAARREGGVPLHPRTWLHQERYSDERQQTLIPSAGRHLDPWERKQAETDRQFREQIEAELQKATHV